MVICSISLLFGHMFFFTGWSKMFGSSIRILQSFIFTFIPWVLLCLFHFQTNCLLTPLKLAIKVINEVNQILTFTLYFWSWLILTQLIVRLSPDSNCFSSFELSWADRAPFGTCSFVLVIDNALSSVESIIKKCTDQVNIRLFSKLIRSISRVPEKLPKYCHEPVTSTSLILLSKRILPVTVDLNLNDLQSLMLSLNVPL